jgi:hypothetical protein
METEERLSRLERQMVDLDEKIRVLVRFAKMYPAGRAMLKVMGLS